MPFKKRKEAKQARIDEIRESRATVEKNFGTAIEATGQMTDPAEKILELRKVELQIASQIGNEYRAIYKSASGQEKKTLLASFGSVAAGTTAIALFAGPAAIVALPVAYAGVLGSIIVSNKRGNSARKKSIEAAQAHIDNLDGLTDLISTMTDVVVENHVKDISKSPLYGKVRDLPGLPERFADAAAKHFAVDEQPAPVEAAPVVKQAPKTPAKKKPPADFGRITKVGK